LLKSKAALRSKMIAQKTKMDFCKEHAAKGVLQQLIM